MTDAEPLHVAVSVLAGTTGGPASYGVRLVQALAALPAPPRVTVLTDAPDRFVAAQQLAVVHVPCRGGIDRVRWQHWALPRALRRVAPDVYHDTKNALPLGFRVPAAVTVHDLAYRVVPETFGWLSRQFLIRSTAHAVRRARIVVVPSAATAKDVARFHPEAAAKVRVVPHGVDAPRVPTVEERERVRARHRLPERYVLHVGTVQARKNVDLLVRGVRLLRAQGLPHRVVLAGRRGWLAQPALAEIARDDTALWLGEVDAQDLPALYAGAAAFVSPSAYEGFGLAVADAMAAGVPVVVSANSSLPEVAGDAGVLLRDLTPEAIAAALRPLLEDERHRARVAAACAARAATFSWQRSAEGHLAAYRAAAKRD